MPWGIPSSGNSPSSGFRLPGLAGIIQQHFANSTVGTSSSVPASPPPPDEPSQGFWPSLVGFQQAPNGALSSLGHDINAPFAAGIHAIHSIGTGILNLFGNSSIPSPVGFTPGVGTTAGGTFDGIDPNTGQPVYNANGTVAAAPGSSGTTAATRTGPAPISHTTGIPGWAAAAMAEIARRNQV